MQRSILLAVVLAFLVGNSHSAPRKHIQKIVFLTTPFVADEIAYDNFHGHSVVQIRDALIKHKAPSKNKFETTQEFLARLDKWAQEPLFGGVTPNSTLAFEFGQTDLAVGSTYDADSESLEIEVPFERCYNSTGIPISSSRKENGTFIGGNAFGVKVSVLRVARNVLCLALQGRYATDFFKAAIKVDRDTAKRLTQQKYLLVVGRLYDPWFETGTIVTDAKIDSPIELITNYEAVHFMATRIMVIDRDNKRVLLNIAADVALRPY